jgi:uncharacterized protein (TIGR00255 family)
MTGFGRAEDRGKGTLLCEVRSVNHRYLSLKLHLPPPLAALENWVDARVRSRLSRGSVTVRVHVSGISLRGPARLDSELADRYLKNVREFASSRGLAADLSVEALLTLPGVLQPSEDSSEALALQPRLRKLIDGALDDLRARRQEEGLRLARAMVREAKVLAAATERIRTRARRVPQEYQKRMRERLQVLLSDSGATLDEQLVAREVAALADRSDVTEELDRLTSHLVEFERLMGQSGPVGRSLEFLIQELGREVQTIGSKALDATILRQILRAKGAIEKLREQSQNLE